MMVTGRLTSFGALTDRCWRVLNVGYDGSLPDGPAVANCMKHFYDIHEAMSDVAPRLAHRPTRRHPVPARLWHNALSFPKPTPFLAASSR